MKRRLVPVEEKQAFAGAESSIVERLSLTVSTLSLCLVLHAELMGGVLAEGKGPDRPKVPELQGIDALSSDCCRLARELEGRIAMLVKLIGRI